MKPSCWGTLRIRPGTLLRTSAGNTASGGFGAESMPAVFCIHTAEKFNSVDGYWLEFRRFGIAKEEALDLEGT
jgi:hypothetical protein